MTARSGPVHAEPSTRKIPMLAPARELAYAHTRSIALPCAITALEAWNLMMSEPQPLMGMAFWLRDAISARFGVKKIGGFSGQKHATIKAGDRLDFFLVEHAEPDLLVLTERDRHLDVMICIHTTANRLTISASVVTHNGFGRLYMLPVGPAHRLIVWNMLRRLARKLSESRD